MRHTIGLKKWASLLHPSSAEEIRRLFFVGFGVFAFVFPAVFLSTNSSDPIGSETAYIEYSQIGRQAGSVIPASCDSDNPYRNPTTTLIDPNTGMIGSSTPGSHFNGDCVANCPSGPGTYDPYYDPGATSCPTATYLICPTSFTVAAGGTHQYRAYYKASGLSCANLTGASDVTALVTWTSSSPLIGTVGNGGTAGLATAVTTTGGTTGITVSSYAGQTAPGATFVVQSSATALRICPTAITMVKGTVYQMRAFYLLGGVDCASTGPATDVSNLVTWTSSAPLIATVNNNPTGGRITALTLGQTNITISNYAGQAAPRSIVFVVGGYAICPAAGSTYSGGTTQLRAYYSLTGVVDCGNLTGTTDVTAVVSWYSSNTGIATVAAGLVTGVSSGVSSITVSPYNGSTALPVAVTVAGAYKICPTSAIVSTFGFPFHSYYNAAGPVDCGNTGALSDVTGSVVWSSSNSGVATVGNGGSAGIATAVSLGSSNITTTPYIGIPTPAAVANVICIPSVTCASAGPAARAANTCPANSFTVDDGCGFPVTCFGTRVCDFNWKEVSQ